MRYRVEGKLHLWGWMDFKSSINAKIIDCKTEDIRYTGQSLKLILMMTF